MEGHDLVTMNNMTKSVWDKYFKQFMYYIAGYDTVAVTAINPRQDLNMGIDKSGISFHPSQEAGVLITKPGNHYVTLYDIAGHKIAEQHGNKTPIDYNFNDDLKNSKRGIYVMRVAVPGQVKSKRVIIQ